MRLWRGQITFRLLKRLKPLDYGIVLAGLIAVILVSIQVYARSGSELSVVIGGTEGEWIYPLDGDRTLEIAGPSGTSVVEIREGHVHMLSSPCKNQTCVAAGAIASEGQWLACLPNKVFVRIEGMGKDEQLDAAVY